LAEWLFEEGIGENRAILVASNAILEAAIELPDEVRVGSILSGRLRDIVAERQRGWVTTKLGEVLVRGLPRRLTQGAEVRVEVVREQVLEPRTPKNLIGRITDAPEREGPSLAERIGTHTRLSIRGEDQFEAAGWHDLTEEAISGDVAFEGGELRLSLTPAMTLIDVDGYLPSAELAVKGAAAAGAAIRRHGIAGSIGIDLPTVPTRAHRQKAAEALDEILPQPFERTSVNGFGFLQVIRKRERGSIPELMQYTPVQSAARLLLRRAERVPGTGARRLTASPAVIRYLERRAGWLDELRRRIGTEVTLQAEPSFTSWSFHVQNIQS
jgi:ribonuclease G